MSIDIEMQKIRFNIIDDTGRIAFYEPEFFDISDNKIGPDCVLKNKTDGYYMILPEIISYDGFFEDYHNDDPIAIEKLKKRFPEFADKLT